MNKYKNIDKINGDRLLALIREVLDESEDFRYISGVQPFFMEFQEKKYFVYVKNISSAYFSIRDKTTRAQLPIKDEFNAIKTSSFPFIFLGYDSFNDVFICWNYHAVKERLNVGKSVSFYSRTFFQSEVKEGSIIRRKLKNGDMPVLFKRTSLLEFFEKIESLFPINPTLKFTNEDIGNYNYEEKFKAYLKNCKKLSDKSINNYTNALKSRISEGLRENFIPRIKTVFFINDISALRKLNKLLFEVEEYRLLDLTGKSMYSCAFNNYIEFVDSLPKNNKVDGNSTLNHAREKYQVGEKLEKIDNVKLIEEIRPYINANRLLTAAQIVGNHYQHKYPGMELSEWINLVRRIPN